MASNFNICGK